MIIDSPEGVADAACIQTVSGRAFVAPPRLSGAEHAFYNQTWTPNGFEEVKQKSLI